LEWATDPQYGYGWAVPILCLGLLVRRWHHLRTLEVNNPDTGTQTAARSPAPVVTILFGILAFCYLPTRLIEGATPEWRPIQWLLGFETIGLTLCAVRLWKGQGWMRQLAFPVCFLFVAIPWPTLVEIPLIQGLTRLSAGIVVEVLGMIGVPAAQHGNVIEVATGMVGIDDACSGIRSFQSSFMISLFLGEFYWLSRSRRLLLVPTCFLLAIVFNICRMSILTLIAARKGPSAIAEYHDGAGLTILMACFATTWGVALLFRNRDRQGRNPKSPEAIGKNASSETAGKHTRIGGWNPTEHIRASNQGYSILNRFAVALLVWLVAVEAGVELWYTIRESQIKPGPAWSVVFPENNPSFKSLPIPEKTSYLLRFDDGKQGQWNESDGTVWQAFYFDWLPGRVAGYLAKRHTPEICMPAAGCTLRSGPELIMLNIHGVVLPMRRYVFDTPGSSLNVYQCRWEAGAGEETYVAQESARYNLIRAIWAGRGNHGQKVLEIVVSGFADPEDARQALLKQLEKLIRVDEIHASATTPPAAPADQAPQPLF
jgi:exosortase